MRFLECRMRQAVLACFFFCTLTVTAQARNFNILERKIDITFVSTPIHEALLQIAQKGGFDLAYNTRIIPSELKVSLEAKQWTVQETLLTMLGNRYVYKAKGNYLIIKKAKNEHTEIIGYIKDPATGERIAGATIYDLKTLRATTSDQNGFYKLKVKESSNIAVSMLNFRDTILSVNPMNQSLVQVNMVPLQPFTQPKPDLALHLLRAEYRLKNFFAAQLDKRHERNVNQDFHRLFQLSIIPKVGTNRGLDGKVSNDISVNLIVGHAHAVRWFEMAGIGNFTEQSVGGFQVAGMFNFNQGDTKGLQMGGLVSTTDGTLTGMQINGILSLAGTSNGSWGQISGLVNRVKSGTIALQISSLVNDAEEVRGMQISSGYNRAKRLKGVQIGLFNSVDACACLQIGLINRVGKRWLPVVNWGGPT